MFGVSRGGVDAALTQDRLEAAGYHHAFDRVVTLGSPFRGEAMPVARQIGSALVDTLERHAIAEPSHPAREGGGNCGWRPASPGLPSSGAVTGDLGRQPGLAAPGLTPCGMPP